MFIFHGAGANGKSTVLGAFQELLGDYAAQTPASTLMVKDVDAICDVATGGKRKPGH